MDQLLDIAKFDSYKRRQPSGSEEGERGTAGVLMGYLFVLCQLLWRSHYPWREGGKRRVRFFAVREKKGWEEPQIEEKLDDVEGTILTLPFKKKVEKKC